MSVLLNITIFQGVDAAELARIEARGRTVEPRDGAHIFTQGEPADAIYAIIAGTGRVRIGTLSGSKGLMVQVFKVGDIFGEIGVLERSTRTAEAVAEGRLKLLRIGDSVFLDALSSQPKLAVNLLRVMATRLRRTATMLQDATFESLEARMARQLLYLAAREGRQTERGIQLAGRFRQSDLADLLGTTNRSIITLLNAWRTDGLVEYDTTSAHLTICQEDALRRLIGDEL